MDINPATPPPVGSIIDQMFGPAPLPPVRCGENTTSVQQAVAQGTLGVGYSGSGLLLFYFIGVSKVLQQLGVIKPGTTKVAATSGGIIGCAPDFGLIDHDTFLKVGKDFVTRCRNRNNCAGQLDSEVGRIMDIVLPPNAHEVLNGTAYIMYATPNEQGAPIGEYVNTYESRDDLAEAIRTGTYLPMWSAPSMTRLFRGKRAYDGGFRRALPCPPDVTYCVTASVLPPLDFNHLLRQLLEGKTMGILSKALRSTLGGSPWQFLTQFVRANRGSGYKMEEIIMGAVAYSTAVNPGPGVHIYPGKYNPNPFPMWDWILKMVIPPTPEEVDIIVEMGVKDAEAWAREVGLSPLPLPVGR
ncbi:hypothetical protein Rsub_02010 [Raphidocelis subcapitata]|uniref:PNPLA domain-containing protein n=1 Tax=Raphidocelis subcapitata TaxID=307507 RepID=A0A2V0NP97_9CHLO|nr:hypothetical protein Rsub_02010 [Raphidocelis subcapitata]|eukprot:GBF89438.1 hypothetical protein Rsub_02010 [Raphidocelis subcapitata]